MFTKNFKIYQNANLPMLMGFRKTESYLYAADIGEFNLPYTGTITKQNAISGGVKLTLILAAISSLKQMDYRTSSSSGVASGIVFGDGTTPPTENDASLSGNLISGNYINTSNCLFNLSYSVDGEKYNVTQLITITNTSETDITISEVGLVTQFWFVQGTSSYYCPVLLERTVLDHPVTIPAGGIGQVTYTLSLEGPFFA